MYQVKHSTTTSEVHQRNADDLHTDKVNNYLKNLLQEKHKCCCQILMGLQKKIVTLLRVIVIEG